MTAGTIELPKTIHRYLRSLAAMEVTHTCSLCSPPANQGPVFRRLPSRRHSPLAVCCQHSRSQQQTGSTPLQTASEGSDSPGAASRRQALEAAASLLLAASSLQNPAPAWAIRGRRPPSGVCPRYWGHKVLGNKHMHALMKHRDACAGFRLYTDKLDGFSFFYPDTWTPVSVSVSL